MTVDTGRLSKRLKTARSHLRYKQPIRDPSAWVPSCATLVEDPPHFSIAQTAYIAPVHENNCIDAPNGRWDRLVSTWQRPAT